MLKIWKDEPSSLQIFKRSNGTNGTDLDLDLDLVDDGEGNMGRWLTVDGVEGALTINTGDMMEVHIYIYTTLHISYKP